MKVKAMELEASALHRDQQASLLRGQFYHADRAAGVPGGAPPGLVLAAGQLAALVAHMPEAAFQVAGRAPRGCPEMSGFQSVSGHQTNDQRSKNVGDDCPPSHLS